MIRPLEPEDEGFRGQGVQVIRPLVGGVEMEYNCQLEKEECNPPANCFAASSHSGCSFLQCPHHGAMNATSHSSLPLRTFESKSLADRFTTWLLPPLLPPPPDEDDDCGLPPRASYTQASTFRRWNACKARKGSPLGGGMWQAGFLSLK